MSRIARSGWSSLLQMLEEAAPAGFVLLGAFADAHNLAVALAIHADRHEVGDIPHLPSPAALDAVEIDVRMCARDRLVAPGLDPLIDLLVEVAHCRRAHPRAPTAPR